MTLIRAPWTDEQVEALNAWQKLGFVHEFTCTCPNGWNLVATPAGWVCPGTCGYTQDWTHDWMADKSKHPKHPQLKGKPEKKGKASDPPPTD